MNRFDIKIWGREYKEWLATMKSKGDYGKVRTSSLLERYEKLVVYARELEEHNKKLESENKKLIEEAGCEYCNPQKSGELGTANYTAREPVKEALTKVKRKYGKMLKNLAK